MIELKNVYKTYQMGAIAQTVLKGISLHISAREAVAICGASGSGKSTLMNIIGLLDRPTSGEYLVNDQNGALLSDDALAQLRNRTFGFVFQQFYLLPRLTAEQNVALPLYYRGTPRQETLERVRQMLSLVGMSDWGHHRPSQLSGGQQQRVAIARAIVGRPEVILADEPTGALDSKTGQEVMDLFLKMHRQSETTLIVITHDHRISEQCERVIEISDGQIVADE